MDLFNSFEVERCLNEHFPGLEEHTAQMFTDLRSLVSWRDFVVEQEVQIRSVNGTSTTSSSMQAYQISFPKWIPWFIMKQEMHFIEHFTMETFMRILISLVNPWKKQVNFLIIQRKVTLRWGSNLSPANPAVKTLANFHIFNYP